MTPRRKILVSVLLLAVTGAVTWQFYRPRIPDPIFEGRHLSYWIGRSAGTESLTAQAAVRAAGTNAIPMLLRYMRAHDSPLERQLISLLGALRFVKFPFVSDRARHEQALAGFDVLGAAGESAVPDLIRIYNMNLSLESRATVIRAFGGIGPDAKDCIPLLIDATTDSNAVIRILAFGPLREMPVSPDVIVPVSLKSLNDSDPAVRAYAAGILQKLGPEAKAAVPKLLDLLAYPYPPADSGLRRMLIEETIKKIDPAAATKAGTQVTNASQAL
jgi:HEAT repeat protein